MNRTENAGQNVYKIIENCQKSCEKMKNTTKPYKTVPDMSGGAEAVSTN